MGEGYVKLFRKMMEWEWFKDANTFRVFLYCLINANYRPRRFMGDDIPVGSFVTSIAKISEDLNISSHQVRTALEHLKNTKELTSKTTNKYTVVFVQNWAKYQGDDLDDDKQGDIQVANKWQTSGKQVATIEESKKERIKEGKNKEPKRAHGEFQHVLLTDKELEKLTKDFPNIDEIIKFFDEYIDDKKYKSENHNLAIRRWVVKAVEERKTGVIRKPNGTIKPDIERPDWMDKYRQEIDKEGKGA